MVMKKTEITVKGVDIMLAVDTSDSMLAKDLGEKNRIETAKEVISKFIARQNGNRLGLVVFSGASFTLSPLTLDYEMISNAIKDVDVSTVKIDGTAIGDAIVNALYRFDYSNKNRNKVIILLTDGENNSGKVAPEKATGMAINKKVKIYTIGIGKAEGTPLIIKDPLTGKEKYSKDVFGNTIYSKINEEDLVKMAKATNGYYFQAIDKKALENIYNKINMLEKAEVVTSKINNYSEKMAYFLIPALILLLLDFLLSKKFLTVVKL
jgi:Ca-activated chloride channel family protein